jgi:hypothetical protein
MNRIERGKEIHPDMFKKFVFTFAALALAIASAASQKITLFQPTVINGQELKPGEYRVEVKDNKAVISGGKQSVEVPVRVENGTEKYRSTTVRYENANGQMKVQEIRLGGTTTKLVVGGEAASL